MPRTLTVKPSALITRKLPSKVIAKVEEHFTVDLYVGDAAISRGELLQRVKGVSAILCLLTDTIDAAVLDAAGPQLRVVVNVAVGENNIDVPTCRARGITVTNTPDVLTNACADFTWGLILAVTRRLGEGERLVRSGQWPGWALDQLLGMELRGKQLGLVGLGRIASAVAARAVVFGVRVAYSSRSERTLPGAERMSLDQLLAWVPKGSPEEALARAINFDQLPAHVAIIMDGNGRWAKQRGLPRIEGHRRGVETVRATTFAARDLGVRMLTLYAFSSENWKRPETEVSALMGLLRQYLRLELKTLLKNNIRFKVIGQPDRLAPQVREELQAAEARTAANTGSENSH